MITEEEKQEIIDKAVEKALLVLPETVGTMMMEQAALNKINAKFYSDYPEFAKRKDIVASVIEKIDSENPGADYKDILKKAVPEIRKQLDIVNNLDTSTMPQIAGIDRAFNNNQNFGNGII